jgi:hypothetical protein
MNIGEEEQKGSILAQGTHALLKENSHINFIGNISMIISIRLEFSKISGLIWK